MALPKSPIAASGHGKGSELDRVAQYVPSAVLHRRLCEAESWCDHPAVYGLFVGTDKAPFACFCAEHLAAGHKVIEAAHPNWRITLHRLSLLTGEETLELNPD